MIKLTVVTTLPKKISFENLPLGFISTKRLSQREKKIFKNHQIKRLLLNSLNDEDSREFYQEFDKFWAKIASRFSSKHYYWRNVVSTRTQEWESSLGYLLLTLFALSKDDERKNISLLILVRSSQERDVIISWARNQRWESINELSFLQKCWDSIKSQIRSLLSFLKIVLEVFHDKFFAPTYFCDNFQSSSDSVLMASLCYPESFIGKEYKDPFLGKLHKFFSQNNVDCMYLVSSLTLGSGDMKKKIKQCSEVNLNLVYSILSWADLILVLFRVCFRNIDIDDAYFMGCNFSPLLRRNSQKVYQSFNVKAEIYYQALKKIAQKHKFTKLLVVFEGNVFERACIQAFRQYHQGKVLGYSHGVLFRMNLKLRLTPEEASVRPEPEKFICPGSYYKEYFSTLAQRKNDKLIEGCALRTIPRFNKDGVINKERDTLLVATDGMHNSVVVLDWLFANTEIFKAYNVILRGHPNVSIKKLIDQCICEKPSNFYVSESTLEEDIKRSFCVLYRHTSVGLQALLNYVPVIHLNIDLPLCGDPLEELREGKYSASSSKEIEVALDEIYSYTEEQLREIVENAKKFSEKYFSSQNEERLKSFL